jgi:CelD/BcsL family acetyltransferase involved in cellulose biosynthesis
VFDNFRSDSPIYAAISELTNNFTVNRLELADFPVMHILSTKQKSPKPKDSNLTREEYLERRARLAKVRHTFETNLAPTGELINEFFRLHKLADTSKPKFMSARMEKLIRYLINLPFTNWKLRLARLQIFGETAALLLYYVSKDCILGYQAGSDANFSYYSPQLLSAALLMEQAQQSGKKKSDLICGLESYKAAITEVPGKLYRIEIKMEHKKLFWKV